MAGTDELGIPYQDIGEGRTHKHKVPYAWLTQNLKERIDALDLTVHDLLREIIIQEKIRNLHLESWTDENITPKDIKWP